MYDVHCLTISGNLNTDVIETRDGNNSFTSEEWVKRNNTVVGHSPDVMDTKFLSYTSPWTHNNVSTTERVATQPPWRWDNWPQARGCVTAGRPSWRKQELAVLVQPYYWPSFWQFYCTRLAPWPITSLQSMDPSIICVRQNDIQIKKITCPWWLLYHSL